MEIENTRRSPIEHRHIHNQRFGATPTSTGSIHETGRWPGIELYYPPIKFIPERNTYETFEEAERRFWKWGATTKATTLVFDLEDGCQRKRESRDFLRMVLPKLERDDLIVAVRINQFLSEEFNKDLEMVKDLKEHIHVLELAKAGEEYGAAEIRDLASWLVGIQGAIAVEPIIEHPKSLKIVDEILSYDPVCHVVFGIHDFSKAMGIRITPENWPNELKTYRDNLLFEARLAGKGVVGGVDTLIGNKKMPDFVEWHEIQQWLEGEADEASRIVFAHAYEESQLGLTGKQVIHPYHIPLGRAAFYPSPLRIQDRIEILQKAMDAGALNGGAILHKGEMLDPPMFGKALQSLLKAAALGTLPPENLEFTWKVIKALPDYALRENWPYSVIL